CREPRRPTSESAPVSAGKTMSSEMRSDAHFASSPPAISFFFQAEDGIRDRTVTGVQTCALPIYLGHHPHRGQHHDVHLGVPEERSEERRVGKECRSRWWPHHEKEKMKRKCRRRACWVRWRRGNPGAADDRQGRDELGSAAG